METLDLTQELHGTEQSLHVFVFYKRKVVRVFGCRMRKPLGYGHRLQ
jgi:hypothetical protein